MQSSLLISFCLLGFLVSGCASVWPMFTGEKESSVNLDTSTPKNKEQALGAESAPDDQIRFSENPNIGSFNEKRYRRVTRKSLEEESDVGSRAGSLWNTEGPSSYLFTQNKLHREGDLLNVKIEGNAKTQVDTKIQVIKKLLARLEIVPTPFAESPQGSPVAGEAPNRDPASVNAATPVQQPSGAAGGATNTNTIPTVSKIAETPAESETPINIEAIPTRVTERMGDGNYRVKGQQSFMIGKKEFRVIVTGLVRPEDFSDEGISSNKLLDPQLDVVSLRRSLQ